MNGKLGEPERIRGAANPTEEVYVIMKFGYERRE